MGRIYKIPFSGDITAANTDVDLCELTPADDKPIKVVSYAVGQISEVGDAQEEGIQLDIITLPATVTPGSGGAAGAENPMDSADAAAGVVAVTMNTTVATTSGTAITKDSRGWNLRSSPIEATFPDPKSQPKAKGAEVMVLRWQTTVVDTVSVRGFIEVEEE